MSTWQEKAREGLKMTAEYISKYGADIGIQGGLITAGVAIGALTTGHLSDSGTALTIAESGARSALTFGVLHAGGWLGAKAIVEKYLGNTAAESNLFGESWERKAAESNNPMRGATVHDFGEIAHSAEFKQALAETLRNIDEDPESKKAMIALLKESPEAQKEFLQIMERANNGETPKEQTHLDALDLFRERNRFASNTGDLGPDNPGQPPKGPS